jgi:hypothetical protein
MNFFHPVCFKVDFVKDASCFWIYLFLSRVKPAVTQPNPTQPKNPRNLENLTMANSRALIVQLLTGYDAICLEFI